MKQDDIIYADLVMKGKLTKIIGTLTVVSIIYLLLYCCLSSKAANFFEYKFKKLPVTIALKEHNPELGLDFDIPEWVFRDAVREINKMAKRRVLKITNDYNQAKIKVYQEDLPGTVKGRAFTEWVLPNKAIAGTVRVDPRGMSCLLKNNLMHEIMHVLGIRHTQGPTRSNPVLMSPFLDPSCPSPTYDDKVALRHKYQRTRKRLLAENLPFTRVNYIFENVDRPNKEFSTISLDNTVSIKGVARGVYKVYAEPIDSLMRREYGFTRQIVEKVDTGIYIEVK